MKHFPLYVIFILLAAATAVITVAGCCAPADPLKGKIITTSPTPSKIDQSQQETYTPPPATSQPSVQQPETNERTLTVTESNSVFSIGLPAYYTEERQVFAQKPIDFWFEYLTPDFSLQVNGSYVEIPSRRSSARVGYTTGVTSFSYTLKNTTAQPLSYNLHMAPSKAGDSVPVVTKEKWIAP